ncbi:MAG: ester cyclase [Myxococcota bacterium]
MKNVNDPTEAIRRQIEAFNARDKEAFRATLCDDVEYIEVAFGRRTTTADEMVESAFAFLPVWPNVQAEVINAFASGDQGAVELRWKGTHTGTFEMPGLRLPPSNHEFDFKAVMIVEGREGKVARCTYYFDVFGMFQNMGATISGPQ